MKKMKQMYLGLFWMLWIAAAGFVLLAFSGAGGPGTLLAKPSEVLSGETAVSPDQNELANCRYGLAPRHDKLDKRRLPIPDYNWPLVPS